MWNSDCSGRRRPAPTGQARRTRQPWRQSGPVSRNPWHRSTSYRSAVRASTGQAVRQGAGQASQGRAEPGARVSSSSRIAPRKLIQSPAVSWIKRPTGEGQARPERRAQAVNGRQGGPSNGKTAFVPSRQAIRPTTRRDQRSSGWGRPSLISGEAATTGQKPGSSGARSATDRKRGGRPSSGRSGATPATNRPLCLTTSGRAASTSGSPCSEDGAATLSSRSLTAVWARSRARDSG